MRNFCQIKWFIIHIVCTIHYISADSLPYHRTILKELSYYFINSWRVAQDSIDWTEATCNPYFEISSNLLKKKLIPKKKNQCRDQGPKICSNKRKSWFEGLISIMLVLIKLIACSTHPYYLWITTKERERAKLKNIWKSARSYQHWNISSFLGSKMSQIW